MGCSGSKGKGGESMGRLSLANGGKLVVWGDHFNSETRAILSILEIADVNYDFRIVNTLEDAHKEESYRHVNPSCTVPMIENGNDKVIGGGVANILYLSGACPKVREHLFRDEDRAEIEKLLNWFYMKMRTETQRLIKLIVPGKVQGGKVASQSASQVQSNKEMQINNIFSENGSLLSVLDGKLKEKRYMASNELSVADIVIYTEISTIMALLSEHHTNDLAHKF